MERKLIRDVFPSSGMPYFFQDIFRFLNLSSEIYSVDSISAEYFLGHSSLKFCSTLLTNLLGGSDAVSPSVSQSIFGIIRSRFGESWTRLYATTIADYNPIHNYDISEQIHRDSSGQTTDTNTKDLTDTINHGMTNTSDDYIYGFNSIDEKNSNKYTSQDGGTTVTKNTGTNTDSSNSTEREDLTTTRSGNIGVTTTQQMLQQERDLWSWNFIEKIFEDIDSILTIRIYDTCRV